MKCTGGFQFYTRLDNVVNENTVAEFIYNIEYKQTVAVYLTTGCLKRVIRKEFEA
jgi:hypothetical protein